MAGFPFLERKEERFPERYEQAEAKIQTGHEEEIREA